VEYNYRLHPSAYLDMLNQVLRQLRQLLGHQSTDFKIDFAYRFAVDRALQLAVDRAVETAMSLLDFSGRAVSAKKPEVFHNLIGLGLIDERLAIELRCHVRFRNQLVHSYDDEPRSLAIRDILQNRDASCRSQFYDHVAPEIVEQDLRTFATRVATYIERHFPDDA
jgi:uncharacterized protein YutE (UPF0331/DUF86 family)